MLEGQAGVGKWQNISSFLRFWLEDNPLSQPEKKTLDTYYTSYRKRFGPYIQHHYAEQTLEICAAIQELKDPMVLEVGTGCGTEALWFALLGARVTAIDLSVDRLAVARARRVWLHHSLGVSLNIEFCDTSLFDFSPTDGFDIIWMEQTFHHLEPRAEVYAKLFKLLKPGGSLFISESNAWNIFMQLQLFLRRGFKTKIHMQDPSGNLVQYGNERITTPFMLELGLKSAGFVVKKTRSFRLLPNSNPPAFWLVMEKLILNVFPFLSTHYNTIAVKP